MGIRVFRGADGHGLIAAISVEMGLPALQLAVQSTQHRDIAFVAMGVGRPVAAFVVSVGEDLRQSADQSIAIVAKIAVAMYRKICIAATVPTGSLMDMGGKRTGQRGDLCCCLMGIAAVTVLMLLYSAASLHGGSRLDKRKSHRKANNAG